MEYSGLLPLIVMVAVVAIAFYVHHVLSERRRQQWREVAAAFGGTLRSDTSLFPGGILASLFSNDGIIVGRYPHPLFQRGHTRCAPNIMIGQYAGQTITCFDYQYTVGGGKNSHTYYFLCALMAAPIPFVELAIRPESIGDKVLGFFGARDIQFESDEFNRRFTVECAIPRFAFDVLHPRAMELLLRTHDLCFEAVGMEVLIYMSRANEPSLGLERSVRRLVEFGHGFLALLPGYLRDRAAARTSS